VHFAAANVVAVLGQIGQMAEIGERTDHLHRLISGQRLEQAFERPVGLLVGIASKRHRELTNLLDQFERGRAFLLPDHIPQDPSQQPDVADQRCILVVAACRGGVKTWSSRSGHGSSLQAGYADVASQYAHSVARGCPGRDNGASPSHCDTIGP